MSREMAFLSMVWLTRSKDIPGGRISESSARPTVVFTSRRWGRISPFSPKTRSSMRTRTRACSSTAPAAWARSTSFTSAKTMSSPWACTRSRVM